jgi:glycosyltransferase involved in cell wall biosynthesis
MKLIIQIPCYNEEETLGITLDDLPKELEGIDTIEYLIINDGSQDNTVQVAKDWGVHHIVNFKRNKGLAQGFMAGIDECLRQGADIIVNTDADNQYCGEDISKLIQPILEGKADMVIGERPIDTTEHFSYSKKKLQRFGSWVVRKASKTDVPDAPSGFRAYTRDCALHLNVINEYTYTLETIVQAGRNKMTVLSVPVRTNPELRKSRLFKSTFSYVKRSIFVIVRAYLMYRPLKFFSIAGLIPFTIGFILGARYVFFIFTGLGTPGGHVQSLLLSVLLILLGAIMGVVGLLADIIAANRRLLEEVRYETRKLSFSLKDEGDTGEDGEE